MPRARLEWRRVLLAAALAYLLHADVLLLVADESAHPEPQSRGELERGGAHADVLRLHARRKRKERARVSGTTAWAASEGEGRGGSGSGSGSGGTRLVDPSNLGLWSTLTSFSRM